MKYQNILFSREIRRLIFEILGNNKRNMENQALAFIKIFRLLPSGQDLQSCFDVPGVLSNGTTDPLGHFLQLSPT